jgi:hypothetical protein
MLLRCITDRADREGRWCLLEATSERSQVRGGRAGAVSRLAAAALDLGMLELQL